MQSGKLCSTCNECIHTFYPLRAAPFYARNWTNWQEITIHKLFTPVFVTALCVYLLLGEASLGSKTAFMLSYFCLPRDDLSYPGDFLQCTQKFYGNWKTFEKRYPYCTTNYIISYVVRNVKRTLFTIQNDVVFSNCYLMHQYKWSRAKDFFPFFCISMDRK